MKADKGYVKAYRRAWENPVFLNFRDASIWQYLFQNAVWEPEGRTVRFDGRAVTLERGQIITSIRFLAEGFCISEKVVRRVLEGIEKGGMAVLRRAHGGTVVTVCNYSDYQESSTPEGHAEGTRRAHDGHAGGTNTNEVKESNEQKESPLSPPKGAVVELFVIDGKSEVPKPDSQAAGTAASKTDARLAAWEPVDEHDQPDLLGSVETAQAAPAKCSRKRSRSKEDPRPLSPEEMAKWNEFRSVYPNRDTPNPATRGRIAFGRRIDEGFDPDHLIEAARAYAMAYAHKAGTDSIQHYATFLNQPSDFWEQCIESAQKRRGQSNVHPLRPGQQGYAERQPYRPKHAGVVV